MATTTEVGEYLSHHANVLRLLLSNIFFFIILLLLLLCALMFHSLFRGSTKLYYCLLSLQVCAAYRFAAFMLRFLLFLL